MIKAKITPIVLDFKRPSGTSRGVLTQKRSWLIDLYDEKNPSVKGRGECSIIESLSPDWHDDYEKDLEFLLNSQELLLNPNDPWFDQRPSIKFGIEMALLDLKMGGKGVLFESDFTKGSSGIEINGLVWMGDADFMLNQINDKLTNGYNCLKLKIGAIDFEEELRLLHLIRNKFNSKKVELRVDANGAFTDADVFEKLHELSQFDLHSIEQPIRPGQYKLMRELTDAGILDIALDEELIGVRQDDRDHLLDQINPPYIILKPSLIGGIDECKDWIERCEKRNIKWWITSALESNVGLSAIAQWTYTLNNPMPQGLGTGQLYTNNIKSPLRIEEGFLFYKE